MILVLFTASYPSAATAEQNFLNEEIKYLATSFERVVIVPRKIVNPRLPLPNNVEVVDEYFSFLDSANKLFVRTRVFASPLFYRDLLAHPWLLFHAPSLGRLFNFLGDAHLTKEWVERWLDKNHVDTRRCLFYTYWFDQGAMGIGLAKSIHPDLKLVSRTHGYDLYEERYSPPYWPGRPASLEGVDALFPDSDAGAKYLRERYPNLLSRIEAAFLGVPDPGFITSSSSDGVLRVVSCSIIRPVKRVDLLLESIANVARQRPSQKIEWHHFGNGETAGVRENLQEYADQILPANARAFFPGYSTQQALMDFYRANPIDIFINVSASEGTPVSSMEAISCGIPVIATGVGGNREIVTDRNGILLSPNPSPQEIADVIFFVQDSPELITRKRKESRALWSERYNAEKNFKAFIRSIKSVRTAGM